MKTRYEELGGRPCFTLSELSSEEQAACQSLAFDRHGAEFRKIFPRGSAAVDEIYERFAEFAPRMLAQASGSEKVPWRPALHTLHERLAGLNVEWWLCGSAALAVRGADLTPRDVDLVTDDQGAKAVASALSDVLVEPLTESDEWIARWFGRAFLGARVEWIGDVSAFVDNPHVTDFGPTAASSLETIVWEGLQLRVPPVYLQLYSAVKRGLDARVSAIVALVRSGRA